MIHGFFSMDAVTPVADEAVDLVTAARSAGAVGGRRPDAAATPGSRSTRAMH